MFKSVVKTVILFTLITLIGACGPTMTPASPTATAVPPSPTAAPPTTKPTEAPPTATPLPPTATMTPELLPTATAQPTATPPDTVSITWEQTYRVNGSEVVHDVLMADDGGYYLVGTKDLVFEPEQNGDIYLIRTDAIGKKLWEKTYGGDKFEEGNTILPTNDGQLMIIGYTASFGATGTDVIMIKVDHDGNELWSKTFGGPLDEMGGGRQMPDGGFILGGNVVDPNDIVADPGAAGYAGYAGRSNVFIARMDGNGAPLWTQTFGGEQNVIATTGVQSPDGGFVILASIIAYPEPGNHIYLLKVDANGQEVWSRTWAEDDASGYALVQTSDGGYLITGPYLPPGSEKEDFLFIKTDAQGNEVWRSTFGDPDMIDYGVVLTQAADGGYMAAGEWVKDYYSGGSDMALVKLDAQGQPIWRQKIETNAHHMLARILQHPDGGYVIATSIVSGRNFDFDIMLIKIDVPVSATPANTTTMRAISADTVGQIELLSTLSGHGGHVTSLAVSRDGSFIASASMDKTIRLWDVASGQVIHTFSIRAACVNNIAFSPDGRLLASSEAIWDVETKQIVHAFEQSHCAAVAFSPDGSILAVANSDGPVALWDVASGQVVRTLDEPNLSHDIEFSPDGAQLAVHREPNAMVKLWDVAIGRLLRTFPQITENYLHGVAFSPDGKLLASAGTEGTTLVWDVATGQVLHTLQGNSCWDVTFSPDGSLLTTSGCDSTVMLWDAAGGRLVRSLKHGGEVVAVVFAPDGSLMASSGYDSKIYLWGIP